MLFNNNGIAAPSSDLDKIWYISLEHRWNHFKIKFKIVLILRNQKAIPSQHKSELETSSDWKTRSILRITKLVITNTISFILLYKSTYCHVKKNSGFSLQFLNAKDWLGTLLQLSCCNIYLSSIRYCFIKNVERKCRMNRQPPRQTNKE